MPIISSGQKELEEKQKIERQADRELLKSVDEKITKRSLEDSSKEAQRKLVARKASKITLAGFLFSSCLCFFSFNAGIFSAVIFSTIPSLLNLIDD